MWNCETGNAGDGQSLDPPNARTHRNAAAALLCAATCASLLVAISLVSCPSANAQNEGINRETTIKAAYLYNFAKYVEWPADYVPLTTADGPAFVIGVVGNDPFGEALATIAREKKVGEKNIVIRHITKSTDDVRCHMIFFPANQNPTLVASVHAKVKDAPILLVGETDDFLKSGGAISFFIESNRVRFEVSKSVAAAAKFKISSKLLNIGREAH